MPFIVSKDVQRKVMFNVKQGRRYCYGDYQPLGDRSFATAGPCAWNKLPSRLRLMQSADTFRRHLKTFLFHQAFLS